MIAQIEVGLLGEQERAAILRLKMKGTPMSRDTDLAGTDSQKSVPFSPSVFTQINKCILDFEKIRCSVTLIWQADILKSNHCDDAFT